MFKHNALRIDPALTITLTESKSLEQGQYVAIVID